MNREGKRCLLYSRVSTEIQVDGYSLDAQKNGLKRFAEREEMTVVDIYEDAGKSGKSIEGRPAFKKLLSDVENGLDVDYVIVYKLSRFGRNAADILNSLALLQTYDVNLICIEEGIDSSQTSGKLLISVLSAVAEIERENILEQTMNGRREKARQGKWNGGPPPYGYMIKDGILQIEEDEAKIVKMIFFDGKELRQLTLRDFSLFVTHNTLLVIQNISALGCQTAAVLRPTPSVRQLLICRLVHRILRTSLGG